MTREHFIIAGVLMVSLLLITMIFFIIFGQITMRKLRKKPEIKDSLGMEIVSGWNILNVAFMLSIPRKIAHKLDDIAVVPLFPNSRILYASTTRTDRVLARILGLCAFGVTISAVALVIVEKLGIVAQP